MLPLSGGTPQKYEEWAVVDTEKTTYSSASSCNKMWISGLLFSLSGSVHLANRSFTLSFFVCSYLAALVFGYLFADIERARGPLVSLANEANLAYG